MDSDWVKIYESENMVKIELARHTLKDAEIEVVLMNKKDWSYGFGEYELFVNRDMAIKAKKILEEFDFE
ncbi:MAG: DUF2007 domain-containing protein [Bacteroidales bacterium]|nr:DUF2007 domain-containing protein [Bacteroidales bacterium]